MKKNPVIGAIIQARTGSSRLPGKIFRNLAGRPILHHVLERLSCCRTLDKVVIATTTAPGDKKIIAFAKERGTLYFAGSQDDVQSRYIEAAKEHAIDIIVRICSDSPFIDPVMIDNLVLAQNEKGADYAVPDPKMESAQEGFEVFSLSALLKSRKLNREAPNREHVTWFIRLNPDQFNVIYLKPDRELQGKFRLSVDNYADYEFARAVYDELYKPGQIVDLVRMVKLLKEKPRIYKFNSHVNQKPMEVTSRRIGFFIPRSSNEPDSFLAQRIEKLARLLNEDYHCPIAILCSTNLSLERFNELGFKTARVSSKGGTVALEVKARKIDFVVRCGAVDSRVMKKFQENNINSFSLNKDRDAIINSVAGKMENPETGNPFFTKDHEKVNHPSPSSRL